MGILKSAASGLKRLVTGRSLPTLASKFSRHTANIGSWGEDIAAGFGVRTRGARPVLQAGKPAVTSINGGVITPATAPVFGERGLTGAGYAAQLGTYGAAGTLGAKMISGTEPTKDKHGVETGMRNDDIIKAREKYQEKIGGAKKFTPALLEHASKDSQWVKSAIKSMGMDKYKKLRARVAGDKAGGNAAGVLHAALIDELAKVGDEEMMKQAATQDYVLPGLAKVGDDARRVIVITNQKGKDKKSSQMALQYEFDEGDDQ